MSVKEWGSPLGQSVLKKLCSLYMRLVWESSTLLTLCTPNSASDEDLSFAAQDLAKLTAKKILKDGKSCFLKVLKMEKFLSSHRVPFHLLIFAYPKIMIFI